MPAPSPQAGEIRWRFGAERSAWANTADGLQIDLAIPVLSGPTAERLALIPDGEPITQGSFRGFRSDTQIAAASLTPLNGASPEDAARAVYTDLLALTEDLPPYRIWNFVPHINTPIEGLESYRHFNIGRGEAYRQRFGEAGMIPHLPSASALGIEDDTLFVAVLGGTAPRQFFENPRQVPASQYPAEHGPRSPSFARGAAVEHADATRTGYLSGTASILGHETIGTGDLALQCETTFANVAGMIAHMDFERASLSAQSYRIYIRRPEDTEAIKAAFAAAFPSTESNTVFVQTNICREALLVEVEAIVIG